MELDEREGWRRRGWGLEGESMYGNKIKWVGVGVMILGLGDRVGA